MRKIVLLFCIFFIILFSLSVISACTPCQETLNLKQTVEKSDLIIIGQRTEYSLNEKDSYPGPDTIYVKIIDVLKGSTSKYQISVNSWDGFCPYGIVVDDKQYVMFLQKIDYNYYDAINSGCSFRTLLVENEMIDFGGNKINIDEFKNMSGLQPSRQFDYKLKNKMFYLYLIITLIVISIVVFIIKRNRK